MPSDRKKELPLLPIPLARMFASVEYDSRCTGGFIATYEGKKYQIEPILARTIGHKWLDAFIGPMGF